MFGRQLITTDVEDITIDNVCGVLQTAMTKHSQNFNDIQYLWEYYRGEQPVLARKPVDREDINNPVVENVAYEIVEFKTGYLTYEAIQLVSNSESETVTKSVEKLNKYMNALDKGSLDMELALWLHVCGLAYRMVLPNRVKKRADGEVPFFIFIPDPRYTFVVVTNDIRRKPVMAVNYVTRADGTVVYNCYTDKRYFKIADQTTVEDAKPNPLGIPIIEYHANLARLGAFEVVLSLADALNEIESNRADAIEKFVQAILVFHNVKIDDDTFKDLKTKGAINIKDIDPQLKAEIEYLVKELNQDQTETLANHLYERILTICGMPNRNGGNKSTSDTGKAVIYRDGWGAAEYRAKMTEGGFRIAEKQFLKLVLKICREMSDVDLTLMDIEIRMPRRNYDNIKEKADVLTMMLENGQIDPRLAFEHCGMFVDPETAYLLSKKYAEEQEQKQLEMMNEMAGVTPRDAHGDHDSHGGSRGGSGETLVVYQNNRRKKKSGTPKDADGDGKINE